MNPKVLIVEDNPISAKMFRLALEAEDYNVLWAEDGATAIQLAAEEEPDIVLLDMVLPDQSGLSVADSIRALPGHLSTPIIACTGFRSEMDLSRMLSAGLHELLVKPVEPSQLTQTVAAYLPKIAASPLAPGGRVLLVDDDPVQLKLANIILTQLGQSVSVAGNGSEALALLRSGRYAVVVSDVLMPRMDGFQLCREIRRDPRLANTAVILVSNHYVDPVDRDLALRVGASDLVRRTPDLAEVVSALKDLPQAPVGGVAAEDGAVSSLYVERVVAQLDRQAVVNVGLARRSALQGATVAVLRAIADVLVHDDDAELAFGSALAHVVNAAGISRALLIARSNGGPWSCTAQLGYNSAERAAVEALFAVPGLAEAIIAAEDGLAVPSVEADSLAVPDLLDRLRAETALLLPLQSRFGCLGIFILSSDSYSLLEPEWRAFSAAMAADFARALTMRELFERQAASERRYRTVMTEASGGIFLLRADGTIAEANPHAGQIFGLSPEALVGVPFASLFIDPEAAAVNNVELSLPALRRDGKAITLRFMQTPVSLDGARHTLVIARDVTLLEALEAERANTLRAEAATEAQNEFLSRLSHELRTPLTVILGFSETLHDEASDPRQIEDLQLITVAARHLRELVNEILDLTLVSSGRMKFELQPVNVAAQLRGLAALARPLAEQLHLRIEVDAPEETWAVQADSTRLHEAILNLVSNAAKYNREGGLLTLRCAPNQHPDKLRIQISDTGRGIDPEDMKLLFEPFERLGVRDVPGTGLGLAVCRKLVESMGGTIGVDSEPGVGSTFWIELPRAG